MSLHFQAGIEVNNEGEAIPVFSWFPCPLVS